MTLDRVGVGSAWLIESVGGERSFRRRLLELGLLPGTRVRVLRIAPMGDPLEIEARDTNLSIRRGQAQGIVVRALAAQDTP